MPNGHLVLKLPQKIRRIIERRVGSGGFDTAEEVVTAAILQWEAEEQFVQSLDNNRLNELLEAGEESLQTERSVTLEDAFSELGKRSEQRRAKRRSA